jgi:hypothetical protein
VAGKKRSSNRSGTRGGRVTPKGGTGSGAGSGSSRRPARQPSEPTPQVGKRPSNPILLFAVAGMWILAGVVVWSTFTAGWKLIPAVVAIGIGLLFLRGAVLTVNRHEERAGGDG